MCAWPSMVTPLEEAFSPESIDPRWSRIAVGAAEVQLDGRLRLLLRSAQTGGLALAQLDDYLIRPRQRYLWAPPLVVELRARFSHPGGHFLGTAGFGLWNNPAPLWSTGMEIRPNWIWFYYASPQSTLSLLPGPPHGFKAAAVCGGSGGRLAMTVNTALLKVPALCRRLGRNRLPALEMTLPNELMADWHDYRLAWLPGHVCFQVDGISVLETQYAPPGPLAFVAWVDNNYAAIDGRGALQVGHLAIEQPQWLELERLSLARP